MTNKTVDELLKLVEEAEKKQVDNSKFTSKDKPHIQRFIEDLKIKTGVERVSTSVVFHSYIMKWSGLSREKKLKKIEFFKQFKRHFNPTRTGKQRYYLLDPQSFDLTREGKLEADHYNANYNKQKRTKSENKKRLKGKVGKSQEEQESKT